MPVVAPPMAPSLALIELPAMLPIASTPVVESITPPVLQAPLSLSGHVGQPEAVSMKVENALMLLDEAFMVRVVVSLERALTKTAEVAAKGGT